MNNVHNKLRCPDKLVALSQCNEPMNLDFRYFLKILEKVPINPQITISNAGINPHKMAGEHSVQQSTGAFVVNTFDCIPAFPATFI